MTIELTKQEAERIYYCLAITERTMRGNMYKMDAKTMDNNYHPTEQEIEDYHTLRDNLIFQDGLLEKFKRLQNCN